MLAFDGVNFFRSQNNRGFDRDQSRGGGNWSDNRGGNWNQQDNRSVEEDYSLV